MLIGVEQEPMFGPLVVFGPGGIASEVLGGRTTLRVRATQDLSSFNLDFLLPVSSVILSGPSRAIVNQPLPVRQDALPAGLSDR